MFSILNYLRSVRLQKKSGRKRYTSIILKERPSHLARYTFFTRDDNQTKNTSISQLSQPPRTPFFTEHLPLATFVL